MKKRILILAGLAGVVGVGSVAAAAVGDNPEPNPMVARAATAADEWASRPGKPASDENVQVLSYAASAHDEKLVASDVRTIELANGREVAVARKSGGLVCWLSSEVVPGKGGRAMVCLPAFPESGAALSYTHVPDEPSSIIGIVADDVTALTAHTKSGASHDVPIVDGAVYWTEPSGDAVTSLDIRGQRVHTEVDMFAAAPTTS